MLACRCGEVRDRRAFAIAALLGAAVCVATFGVPYITGHSSYWSYPVGDAGMQLTGYRAFVADGWHFPLLHTTMIQAPHGISVIDLDVVPIVAFTGRLLRPVLGTGLNPYGWWMLACYVLMAWFATRLVRAFGQRTAIAAVLASVFALTFHPFLDRFFHQGLQGQFVVVWALCLYFELGPEVPLRRQWASWTRALVVSLLVHPYLFAMAGAVFAAAVVRGMRAAPRRRAALLGSVVVTVLAIGFMMGHFSREVRHARSPGGYGESSLNLGSLVVPNETLSVFAPGGAGAHLDATGMQWDGSLFLGVGVLILLAVHGVTSRHELRQAVRAHASLAVVFALLVLYGVGTPGYLFHIRLWAFDVPPGLRWVTDQLRANGRLAWPFGFFVAISVVPFTLRRFRPRIALPLLGVCALLEIVDARPPMRIAHANTTAPWPRSLDWEALRPAIAAHDRVEQWPTYQCLGGVIGMLDLSSRELQFLAASAGRPINGVRAARHTTSCTAERLRWTPFATSPGTLSIYPRATMPAERPPSCRPVGPWIYCTDRWALPALDRLRTLADRDEFPAYRRGDVIDPTQPSAAPYLDGAWSMTYYPGWVEGGPAGVRMQLDPASSSTLVIDTQATGAGELHVTNGAAEIAAVAFDPKTTHLEVPVTVPSDGRLELGLRTDHASLRIVHLSVR